MGLINKMDGNRELIKADKQKLLKKELEKVLKGYGIKLTRETIKGQGSMSFTYKAKDKNNNKLIIKCVVIDRNYDPIKVSRATREVEQNDRKAFETEYRALASMQDSDYCVHLYTEARREGNHTVNNDNYLKIDMTKRYYAYGLIETQYNLFITGYEEDESVGYSVANFSDAVNDWSNAYSADCVASWIGLCIARCLCDMKKNNIGSHRDIKPANIFIDVRDIRNMFDCRFVLADFGIAYLNDSGDEKLRKARVGTMGYRPPDEFMAHDWRDDQYMLGKTLCEYYGVLKPSSSQHHELESRDLWGKSFTDNKYGVRDIIFRMIKDNPNERYQSVEELISAFEEVLKKIDGGKYASLIPKYGNSSGVWKNPIDVPRNIFKYPWEYSVDKKKEEDIPKETDKQPEKEEKPKQKPVRWDTGARVALDQSKAICTYIKKGKTEKARKLIEENSNKGIPYLLNRLDGLCCYFEGNTVLAKQCFERARKHDIVSAYYCFALEQDNEEKFRILQEIFLKMDDTHPFYPAVCYNLYKLYRDSDFVKRHEKTIKANKKKVSPSKLFGYNAVLKDIQLYSLNI